MRNDVPRNVQGRSVDPFSSHATPFIIPASPASPASPAYQLTQRQPRLPATHKQPTVNPPRAHNTSYPPYHPKRRIAYVASGPPSAMGHDGGIRGGHCTVLYVWGTLAPPRARICGPQSSAAAARAGRRPPRRKQETAGISRACTPLQTARRGRPPTGPTSVRGTRGGRAGRRLARRRQPCGAKTGVLRDRPSPPQFAAA